MEPKYIILDPKHTVPRLVVSVWGQAGSRNCHIRGLNDWGGWGGWGGLGGGGKGKVCTTQAQEMLYESTLCPKYCGLTADSVLWTSD